MIGVVCGRRVFSTRLLALRAGLLGHEPVKRGKRRTWRCRFLELRELRNYIPNSDDCKIGSRLTPYPPLQRLPPASRGRTHPFEKPDPQSTYNTSRGPTRSLPHAHSLSQHLPFKRHFVPLRTATVHREPLSHAPHELDLLRRSGQKATGPGPLRQHGGGSGGLRRACVPFIPSLRPPRRKHRL